MIRELRIHGFKKFRSTEVELRALTVLAGLNGSGKSSLIQMLLIMKAAIEKKSTSLELNGLYGLQLGGADSIRSWDSEDAIIAETVENGGLQSKWVFTAPGGDRPFLNVLHLPESPPQAFSSTKRLFAYLSAERFGPRQRLPEAALPPEFLEVGIQGQYSAQIITEFGNKAIEYLDRRHPDSDDADPLLLKYQLERWLSEISRPIEVDAVSHSECSVSALRFRSPGGEWVSSPNMGFGVTYSLPVVLAGLIALPGGMLIVENPEAHLHPAGQSRMGQYLAWLAAKGVQVILETHSDHVLNGIRAAIAVHDYLPADDAIVNYFEVGEKDTLDVRKIEFAESGALTEWPRGFFDQYRIDVASLGRVRRRVQ